MPDGTQHRRRRAARAATDDGAAFIFGVLPSQSRDMNIYSAD